jgi:carboxyl-terminal processing protease
MRIAKNRLIAALLLSTSLIGSMFMQAQSVQALDSPYAYCQLLQPQGKQQQGPNTPGSAPLPNGNPGGGQNTPATAGGANSSGPPDERKPAIPSVDDLLKTETDGQAVVDKILAASVPKKPEELEAIYQNVYQTIASHYIEPSRLNNLPQYEHKYDGKIKTWGDLRAAIKDLIESVGDRWTWYQDPATSLTGIMTGAAGLVHFGAFLRRNADGTFMVEAMEAGSTAQLGGIREGDSIISINGQDLKGMAKEDADKLLKKAEGDQLHVVSVQDGQKVEADYTLHSPPDDASQPKADVIENNIAYIKLPSFMDEDTFAKLVTQLITADISTPGGLQGIVLDLRYNGGGLVDMAKSLIALLNSDGLVLHEKSRETHGTSSYLIDKAETILPLTEVDKKKLGRAQLAVLQDLQSMPLVILINGSSASASEIVAGSLQEARPNTTVMGERSFGKGVEMLIAPLPNCAQMAVTSGAYTTPSGKWLHNVGIAPDITVHQPRGSRDDAQMAAAVKLLKEKSALWGGNIAVTAPKDTAVLGPVPVRPLPEPVDPVKKFWDDNGWMLWRGLLGLFILAVIAIYLRLAPKNRMD